MNNEQKFYTLKGYQLHDDAALTPAMEDYLEMIFRLSAENGEIRVGELSRRLNVRPSSTTKMVQQLSRLGYIEAERYGGITLTETGKATGSFLLRRHNAVHGFLCYLNNSRDELREAEQIEHFISRRTVDNLELLMQRLLLDDLYGV